MRKTDDLNVQREKLEDYMARVINRVRYVNKLRLTPNQAVKYFMPEVNQYVQNQCEELASKITGAFKEADSFNIPEEVVKRIVEEHVSDLRSDL